MPLNVNDHDPLQASAATTKAPSALALSPISGLGFHSAMSTGSSYLASPITPGPGAHNNTMNYHPPQAMTPEFPSSSLALTTRFLDHSNSMDAFSTQPSPNISPPPIQVIRLTSHELLLNNEGYRYILARNNELQEVNANLQRIVGDAQGRLSQQKDTLEELMAKMVIGNHASNNRPKEDPFPELDPDDYPEVNFWMCESWAPYLQNGEKYRFRNNEHHMRRNLQLASGEIISKTRVAQMSSDQRSLWVKYRTQGTMPDMWSQAGADILEDFRTEMYRRYPELTYCKDHYKLALFAGDRYPSWIRHRSATAVKIETVQSAVPTTEDEDNKPHTVRVPKRAHPASIAHDADIMPQAKRPQYTQHNLDSDSDKEPIIQLSATAGPSHALSPCPRAPRIPSPSSSTTSESPSPPTVSRIPSPQPVSRAPSPQPVSHVPSPQPFSHAPTPQSAPRAPAPRASIIDDPIRRKALADKLLHGGFDDPLDGGDGAPAASTTLGAPALLPPAAPPPPAAAVNTPANAMVPGGGPPMNASLTAAKSTKIRIVKKGTTARNLAAVAYVKSNHNATADQFAQYYENLGPEDTTMNETRQRFGQAHAAKTPGATAEDVVTAFENASEDDLKVFREAAIAHLTKPKKVRKDAKGKGKAA